MLVSQSRAHCSADDGQGLSGREADGGSEGSDWRRLQAVGIGVESTRAGVGGGRGVSFFLGVSSPALRWPTALARHLAV